MLLILSAAGVGAVSAWSVSGRRLSARNMGSTLVAMGAAGAEVKVICSGIPVAVLTLTMASTLVIRPIRSNKAALP